MGRLFARHHWVNLSISEFKISGSKLKLEEDRGLQTDKNEGTIGGQQRGNKLWRT